VLSFLAVIRGLKCCLLVRDSTAAKRAIEVGAYNNSGIYMRSDDCWDLGTHSWDGERG
jgi:hypothetical protein